MLILTFDFIGIIDVYRCTKLSGYLGEIEALNSEFISINSMLKKLAGKYRKLTDCLQV